MNMVVDGLVRVLVLYVVSSCGVILGIDLKFLMFRLCWKVVIVVVLVVLIEVVLVSLYMLVSDSRRVRNGVWGMVDF